MPLLSDGFNQSAMILAGQLLLDDASGRCRVAPGYVRIDDDVIAEVVEGEIPQRADAGDAESLIAPGFIDAHVHLPQFDMIGAHGLPLLRWLAGVTFPAEIRWCDVEHARSMTQRVISQLLSVGTTGICAFATVHHASARAALQVAQASGIRGVIGQVLMNREAPPELCRPENQLLEEARKLTDEFPASNRLAAAITPRFAVSCTESLLAGAAKIAMESNSTVQTHLAETVNECELVKNQFGVESYVEVYRRTGLLGPKSLFGHGIHLSETDRKQLHDSDSVVAHCPTANSFLRSGTMRRQQWIRDGVAVAVGSDIGAGYERSMVRVARAMIEAAASVGDDFPDAATAWRSITAGNADLLGWKDAGRIAVGAAADLLVIRPDIPWRHSAVDPLAMLMFAWDDRWLQQTMLRGQFVN